MSSSLGSSCMSVLGQNNIFSYDGRDHNQIVGFIYCGQDRLSRYGGWSNLFFNMEPDPHEIRPHN